MQHAKLGVQKGDGLGGGDSVDHPNRYFDKSRQIVRDVKAAEVKEEEKTTGVKKEVANGRGGGVKKEEAMEIDN